MGQQLFIQKELKAAVVVHLIERIKGWIKHEG